MLFVWCESDRKNEDDVIFVNWLPFVHVWHGTTIVRYHTILRDGYGTAWFARGRSTGSFTASPRSFQQPIYIQKMSNISIHKGLYVETGLSIHLKACRTQIGSNCFQLVISKAKSTLYRQIYLTQQCYWEKNMSNLTCLSKMGVFQRQIIAIWLPEWCRGSSPTKDSSKTPDCQAFRLNTAI